MRILSIARNITLLNFSEEISFFFLLLLFKEEASALIICEKKTTTWNNFWVAFLRVLTFIIYVSLIPNLMILAVWDEGGLRCNLDVDGLII